MNQPTHAWLAVEAYKKLDRFSRTPEGTKKQVDQLLPLLGGYLRDVVVSSWLPDSLIKDMSYGHVFKNSAYSGDQALRFTLSPKQLTEKIQKGSAVAKMAFPLIPDDWWAKPYRVKTNGGHLPARINAISQTIRDMFKMGDSEVQRITGKRAAGAEIVDKGMLFTPKNIATMFWMISHYIADAHMPFHCDNRAVASTSKQKTHGDVEALWGEQVPHTFHSKTILTEDTAQILATSLPANSRFADLDFGSDIGQLVNDGDSWKEAVYICRASFANSFALVPPAIAPVDDQVKTVGLQDILGMRFCGETRFWELSRAVMRDAVAAIAMFWLDSWCDFIKPKSLS